MDRVGLVHSRALASSERSLRSARGRRSQHPCRDPPRKVMIEFSRPAGQRRLRSALASLTDQLTAGERREHCTCSNHRDEKEHYPPPTRGQARTGQELRRDGLPDGAKSRGCRRLLYSL